ncbi:uncharacterized protein EDB93DRAFT_1190250 [Suillus bovinus]|uniref:uncharacterized protein n=1 Tax=Suillus bovinus TaxID=48563 RepID=UPI001B87BE7C|nr:uncharacterized protein EDB93DRAFT_1190250 [Suillus bovinus]KAG2125647.1 hypothetical protein EDB93DRAFT_1190250 [Suillus bovinus]
MKLVQIVYLTILATPSAMFAPVAAIPQGVSCDEPYVVKKEDLGTCTPGKEPMHLSQAYGRLWACCSVRCC